MNSVDSYDRISGPLVSNRSAYYSWPTDSMTRSKCRKENEFKCKLSVGKKIGDRVLTFTYTAQGTSTYSGEL